MGDGPGLYGLLVSQLLRTVTSSGGGLSESWRGLIHLLGFPDDGARRAKPPKCYRTNAHHLKKKRCSGESDPNHDRSQPIMVWGTVNMQPRLTQKA
jgi:hypothetical protein